MRARNYYAREKPKRRTTVVEESDDDISETGKCCCNATETEFDLNTFAISLCEYLDTIKIKNSEYDYILDDIKFLIEDYLSNFIMKE